MAVNHSVAVAGALSKQAPWREDSDVLVAQVKTGQDSSRSSAWAFLLVALGYSLACVWYECHMPKEAPVPGPPGHITNVTRTDPWDFVNFVFCMMAVFAHVTTFVHLYFHEPMSVSGFWWHGVPYVLPGIVLTSAVRDPSASRYIADTFIGLPCTIVMLGLLISLMSKITPGPPILEVGMSIVDWYLQALFLWRLLVGPLFFLARHFGVPTSVPFAVVLLGSYFLWQHVFMYVEPVGGDVESEASVFTTPWHLWVVNAPIFAVGSLLTQDQWTQELFRPKVCWLSSLSLVLYALFMVWPVEGFRAWFSASCAEPGQCTQQWYPVELLVEGINLQTFGVFIKVFMQKAAVTLCIISAVGSWGTPLRRHVPRFGAIILGSGRRWVYVYLLHWALFCVPAARSGVTSLLFGDIQSIPSSYIIEPAALCIAFGTCLVLGSRLTELCFCWLLSLHTWVYSCCFLPQSQARGRRAGPPPSPVPLPGSRTQDVTSSATTEEEEAKQSADAWLASLPRTPGFLAGRPRVSSQAAAAPRSLFS